MFVLLLIVHLVATTMMAGLIWFVQLVHYPLFSKVSEQEFVVYELEHQRRTAWVVGPLMFFEAASAITLVFWSTEEFGLILPLTGVFILGGIHLSTLFLQVPKHRELSSKFDPRVVDELVSTNWVRTVGWSARGFIAAAMLLAVS